jgi:hypothetical protein
MMILIDVIGVMMNKDGLRGYSMCNFGSEEKEKYVHEDWGNIQAGMDEKKTNEEEQKKYDDKKRVW